MKAFNNGGQIPAHGNEKTSAQIISELKQENALLKHFIASIKKIVYSEWSAQDRIIDIKMKFPMR